MKKDWELKKLGDVCYSKSSNVAQNQLADEVGDYPIFGASGLIKNVSFYHRDKPYLSIVKDGSGFGRITKMDAFTSVIGTLQYILPNDDIDLDYLNYSLMSVDFKKYVQGAAIPHIYFKDYKNEPFLWMPLSEQQHIVAILDEVFAAIAKARTNAEQNLKNAKELFASYLQEVFEKKGEGWAEKTLGEVCSSKSSNVSQNQLADEVGDYPIFGASGLIKNVSFYHRDKPYLSIVKDGSGFGRITKMDAFTSVIGTLQYILPNDDIDLDYLNYSLMSVDFKKYVQGAAIPHIYFKDYKNEPFLWMPLQEQKNIVQKLDALSAEIKKLEEIYNQKLNDLEELKKSVLQKAYSGELKTVKALV